MAMNWKTGTLFAVGLVVGVAAGVAGVLGLGDRDEPPASASASSKMGGPAAPAAAGAPVVVAGAAPRCADLTPLLGKGPDGDGKESLRKAAGSSSASDISATLLKGKEAAAGERQRDAEILFLNACRDAQAMKGSDVPAADAQYQLARHYANAAAFGAPRAEDLYERANRLYTASLQIYQVRHGATHEKTRFAREGLATVQQVTGVLPPLPAPVVAQAKPAAPAAASASAAPEQAGMEARAARDQAAKEQVAREQAAKEQAAREQAAKEQAERERVAMEQAAREQVASAQAANEQAARDKAARELAAKSAKEAAAREQVAREQAARELAAREKAAREAAVHAAKEQAAMEKAAREAAAKDAKEQAAREQAIREATAKAAKEQAAREQAIKEAAAKAAKEQAAREQAIKEAAAKAAKEQAAREQASKEAAAKAAKEEAARERVAAARTESSTPPASPRVTSPSFNCAQARSVTEKLICGDEELARMDRDLGRLHQRAKEAAPDRRAFQRASDAEWKHREETCRDRECLRAWYAQRRQELGAAAQAPRAAAPAQRERSPRPVLGAGRLQEDVVTAPPGTASGSATAGMGSN